MELGETEKICPQCKKLLPLQAYYQIRASNESKLRWEKVCKKCKTNFRKIKKNKSRRTPGSYISDELPKSAKHTKSTIDYSHWEVRYGKKLNETERFEIKNNLSMFLTLLAGEHLK